MPIKQIRKLSDHSGEWWLLVEEHPETYLVEREHDRFRTFWPKTPRFSGGPMYEIKTTDFTEQISAVNNPKHYNTHASGVECIDVVEHMTFNLGNAVKYIWRAGLKGDLIEDLEKASWYINREINRLKEISK